MEKPIHAKPSYYAIMFEPLKEIALKYGYNLVLHGSLNRDLDLIAIPWTETVGSVDEMIDEFCQCVGGEIHLFHKKRAEDDTITGFRFTPKPHGRVCYVIDIYRGGYLNGGGFSDLYVKDPETYIDISVMPIKPTNSEFIEIKENLYSNLAKANNLVEIGPNVWIKNGNTELKYRLTKLGFERISISEPLKKPFLHYFFK